MFEAETVERMAGSGTSPTGGLGAIGPGLFLALMLDQADRGGLNGYQLVELIQARARQIAHLQAELYADIAELAHTPPGGPASAPDRLEIPDEFVADEVSLALRLTNRSAHAHIGLALQLQRLPRVALTLSEGRIDLARARVICEETLELGDDAATAVASEILAEAAELTTGQIGRRLRRLIMRRYPEAARKRYRQGLDDRKVESRPNPDGTADLAGRHLPSERVAAIAARIDAFARRLKQRGDDRPIDQIRADIFCDILEGNSTHTSRRNGGVRITVDITTLIRLTEEPGELEGYGPVISDLARQIALQQTDGSWEYVVVDPDTGQPLATGTTRRRPTTAQRRHVQALDRTCIWPTCPIPAYRCHLDHIHDFQHGGTTLTTNLTPECPHHHLRTKHRAGWRLQQPTPGTYVWTSPRGHTYTIRPPPR